ncbi:hypothetical protein V5O48_018981, partial [Marasmius crinis-equi]
MSTERKQKSEEPATRHSKIVVLPGDRAQETQLYWETRRLKERSQELESLVLKLRAKVNQMEVAIQEREEEGLSLRSKIQELGVQEEELRLDITSLLQWEDNAVATLKLRRQQAH